MGCQNDVWMYDDEEFCAALQKIFSGIYAPAVRHKVEVEGPMWSVVSRFRAHSNDYSVIIIPDLTAAL